MRKYWEELQLFIYLMPPIAASVLVGILTFGAFLLFFALIDPLIPWIAAEGK